MKESPSLSLQLHSSPGSWPLQNGINNMDFFWKVVGYGVMGVVTTILTYMLFSIGFPLSLAVVGEIITCGIVLVAILSMM